jgi:uncharacterized protein (DUF362 family)
MNQDSDSSSQSVNRRRFLAGVAAWSAGVLSTPPLFQILPQALAAPAQPTLVVAKGLDYEALVKNALEPLGGIEAFVKKGARIVVKPNIGWDRTPEQAATTHPAVVKAMVRLCLSAGAGKVMVFDRTCNDCRRTYASTGIMAAVESLHDARAVCTYVDDRKFVPVKIQNGKALTDWDLYKDALDCDAYINLPIAKHHGLAKLTIGLKNVMGVIGGRRGQIHQSMPEKLADLNTVVKPKLTLVDATRILLRNGPSGGNMEDVKVLNTLIASADPVAADAFATTLFDKSADWLETTCVAAQRGLGIMDLHKVKVVRV